MVVFKPECFHRYLQIYQILLDLTLVVHFFRQIQKNWKKVLNFQAFL